jgi:hypothetical protein
MYTICNQHERARSRHERPAWAALYSHLRPIQSITRETTGKPRDMTAIGSLPLESTRRSHVDHR